MKTVNVNQLVHCGSPFYMGIALHSWTVAGKLLDGSHTLGFIIDKPKTGLVTADARVVDEFGSNSLELEVNAIRSDGTVSTLLNYTLDSSSEVGIVDMLQGQDPVRLYAGDILYVQATYIVGVPLSPHPLVALLFQVG